jgi:CMP-N,N'-diacetyllegionaminic acid synthase
VTRPSIVALIPARAGSKRLPGKNVLRLGGHPLIAYTIAAALDSGIFADVIVSTDSEEYAEIARHYGANVPVLRPAQFATDVSPDVEWVEHALTELRDRGCPVDCFSILRPTSPFRQAATIRRAWDEFLADPDVDSLRAVEPCRQHPGKMWVVDDERRRMTPLLHQPSDRPWHSSQLAALPKVYVQNASLEMAWSRVVFDTHTIAGSRIKPFFTEGREGFDINTRDHWIVADEIVRSGEAALPAIGRAALHA